MAMRGSENALLLLQQFLKLLMNILPFAQTGIGKKMLAASTAKLAAGETLCLPMVPLPEFEVAEKIRVLIAKLHMSGIGRLLLLKRPLTRILNRKCRRDNQHFFLHPFIRRGNDHPRKTRINGKTRKLSAQRREFQLLVNSSEFQEGLVAVRDELGAGPVDKWKCLNGPQAQSFHLQNHGRKIGAKNFRFGKQGTCQKILFGIEPNAHAGGNTPATPHPLIRRCLRNRLNRQTLDLAARSVAGNAGKTGINDITDAGNSQRRLGNVRGENNPATPGRLENTLLLRRGKPGKQRQNINPHTASFPKMTFKFACSFADFTLAGKKNKNITGPFSNDLIDSSNQRLEEIGFFFVEVLRIGTFLCRDRKGATVRQ